MSLILSVALPHLVLLAAGLGIVSGLKKIFRWTTINAFIFVPLSYLIGELFVVVLLYFSSLIFSRFLWPLLWGFLAAFFLIWLVRIVRLKKKRTLGGNGWKKVFSLRNIAPVLLILVICLPNIKISFYDSLDQQDPRLIWFFHGKAFFYDNQIDPSYLANPEYIWSQPPYPVFVSLLAVYHAHFLGAWHEILNKSFIFFHWIASLILLYFLLRAQRIPPIFALLGIAFLPMIYHKFAMIGVCDSIWGLNFLIGLTLCLSSLENGAESAGRLPLLLGYSFLSMVALTKNEGLAGSLVFISLFSLISLAAKKHLFKTLVFFFGFFALLVFPWYVFTTVHHLKLLWPKPVLGFLRFTFPEIVQRAKFILIYPFSEKLLVPEIFYFMVGSLGLSLALLLGNIKRISKFLCSWLILATNILLLIVYFMIYMGTPQAALEFELKYALERVLAVNFMLCLLTLLFLTKSHAPLASNPLE